MGKLSLYVSADRQPRGSRLSYDELVSGLSSPELDIINSGPRPPVETLGSEKAYRRWMGSKLLRLHPDFIFVEAGDFRNALPDLGEAMLAGIPTAVAYPLEPGDSDMPPVVQAIESVLHYDGDNYHITFVPYRDITELQASLRQQYVPSED